jgi:hypothetical protein
VVVKRGAGGRFMGSISRGIRQNMAQSSGMSFGQLRRSYHLSLQGQRDDPNTKNLTRQLKESHATFHNPGPVPARDRFRAAVHGRATERALRERGHKPVYTKVGVQIHSPASGVNTGKGKATVQHSGMGKAGKSVKAGPPISGRQVGVRANAHPVGQGVIAQSGMSLGKARDLYSRQVTMYRQHDPKSGRLGGALTRSRLDATGQSTTARREQSLRYDYKGFIARSAIGNRAVARVISENRARASGSRQPGGGTQPASTGRRRSSGC